jgi:hypothetical protein
LGEQQIERRWWSSNGEAALEAEERDAVDRHQELRSAVADVLTSMQTSLFFRTNDAD